MERLEIGRVTHYYSKIGVAVIKLDATLNAGNQVAIIGSTTDLEQKVKSMQVEHRNIDSAKPGDLVGLKVAGKVREGDTVFKLLETE
ncbi:MAG TPA: hypothetical protein VLH18_02940 [Candidatus Limnocylindrales bacterium]|nr:hypothetical protein [Candidatus Limnocylindrales bacterium]